MAVYTEVSRDDAAALLARLGLGAVARVEGVAAGIENTNHFVDGADGRRWVLTLFERMEPAEAAHALALMAHLSARGLPVPRPAAGAGGALLHALNGRPAALVERLAGAHVEAPDLHHCEELGSTLARMHLAVADFALDWPNPRGLAWWRAGAPRVAPHLDAAQRALLHDELEFQAQLAASAAHAALPGGVVHADLFRDNVLFDGPAGRERLSGCLDFYFAGRDAFAYDLAVALNDWCGAADPARLDDARAAALVGAYRRERPLDAVELRLMPALLRAAALRFWLSRLVDRHLPRPAALLEPKPPEHFERLLRERIASPWHPPATGDAAAPAARAAG